MKSFLSVICLSHVYSNVVTGTISIAIISLQLQLPKDYLKPPLLNASRGGCREERSVIRMLVFAGGRDFMCLQHFKEQLRLFRKQPR